MIEILERDGQISRNQCLSMFPASTRLGALSENEEAVRDLRRTVFSSQCQLIAGPLKQTFYRLILTGGEKNRENRLRADPIRCWLGPVAGPVRTRSASLLAALKVLAFPFARHVSERATDTRTGSGSASRI
jgi:hypothetical protein